MPFRRGPDYLALPRPEQTWILKSIIPSGGFANIFGKPKTGKSMAALQLASAVSDPRHAHFLSFPILLHGPVAYLQIDTPRSLWMERLEMVTAAGYDFSNVFFADDQDVPYPFNILGEGYDWIRRELAAMPELPVLVVIDTLREIHAVSEDDSTAMKNVVSQVRAAIPSSAVLLVSHSRKGNSAAYGVPTDIMDENRGSGAVAGRMDTVLWLQERTLSAKGRALPLTEIAVDQDPEHHTIRLADPFLQSALEIIRLAPPGTPSREIARQLSTRFPKKSFEACRSLVRRLMHESGPIPASPSAA